MCLNNLLKLILDNLSEFVKSDDKYDFLKMATKESDYITKQILKSLVIPKEVLTKEFKNDK